MKLSLIYESIDKLIKDGSLLNQASILINKVFHVDMSNVSIQLTNNGRFSHIDNGVVYLRPDMNSKQAVRELVHEIGHEIFKDLGNEFQNNWLNLVLELTKLKHFTIHQADEIFARIFEATVLSDKLEPMWQVLQQKLIEKLS